MNDDIKTRLDEQDAMLRDILFSTEKTRKYFLWTLIATLVVFFLPLLGLLFAIPRFIDVYSSNIGLF
ncbi:hypothetical protein L0Y49_03795 [bacterium]|nr:hypothetical protein [bacterium]